MIHFSPPLLVAVLLLVFTARSSDSAYAQQPLPAEGDESQLIGVLNSDAELFEKAKACQRLAVIGTPNSIPALTHLLAHPELSHYARTALEANPSARVDQAFRDFLGKVKGARLVGVINSIAVRRDRQAAGDLVALMSDDDATVAAAATSALGALATTESVSALRRALRKEGPQRVTAADACLSAADTLLLEEKYDEALEILKALRSADLPQHLQVAARFGELRAPSQNVNQKMESYLNEEDSALFRIGLELAHELTDAETTRRLVKMFDSLPASRQVLLLYVLGERGDRSALNFVTTAMKSEDIDRKRAAASVLGQLGDRSVVPMLLEAAVSDNETLASTAVESLVELSGDGVDDELASRLENSEGPERLVLVDVVGRRAIGRTIPILLKFAASNDARLRNSAIEGLGMTVGLRDFPQLVEQMLAMGSSKSAESMKEALRKACQRMGNRDAASQVLLDRMPDASPSAQVELMDLLVYVGGSTALEGAQAAAASDDNSAADAATAALGRWLTPDAAPVLLDLAQSGNPAFRVRCLRGYIRIIRQFGLKPRQRLQMSKRAFAAATRDEERKLVLDTLTRFPSAQGLNMVAAHLKNANLSEAAGVAAVAIGERIVDNDPKSVASVMPQIIAETKSEQTGNRARLLLSRAISR